MDMRTGLSKSRKEIKQTPQKMCTVYFHSQVDEHLFTGRRNILRWFGALYSKQWKDVQESMFYVYAVQAHKIGGNEIKLKV